MPDPSLPVRPSILAVPDRVTAGLLRVSLQITPAVDKTLARHATIDLSEWPRKIAERSGHFEVYIAPIKANGLVDVLAQVKLGEGTGFKPRDWTGSPANGAEALWKASFPSGFVALHKELSKLGDPSGPADDGANATLAPTIDSHEIATALLSAHLHAADDRITRLTTAGSGTASKPDLAAWRLEGTDPVAIKKREAVVRTAITTAIARFPGPSRSWQNFSSYALLDAYANAERLAGRNDPALDAALADALPSESSRLRSRLKSLALTVPIKDHRKEPIDDIVPETGEVDQRKLATILTYPLIAKYLGMIVDLEIPVDLWSTALGSGTLTGRGALAVTFADDAPDGLTNWTAYLLSPASPNGLPVFFGPATQSEATGQPAAPDEKLVRGLLNLAATRKQDGTEIPRFSLSVVDAVSSAKRQIAQAQRTDLDTGAGGSFDADDYAELGGRGIALIDSAAQESEIADRRAAEELAARAVRLHFAGDLLLGYRPAVAITPKGADSLAVAPDRWRSLVARTVRFGAAVDISFAEKNYNAEREPGHTRSPVGVQKSTDSNGRPLDILLNHPELFVWNGDSLAVAARNEKGDGGSVKITAEHDLPVAITYALPNASTQGAAGLMPLRDGRRYVFGASAMFVNGCGLGIGETAAALAADPSRALGDRGRAFTFGRCERVPPPEVLLAPDSRLATTSDLSNCQGQTLTTLVIRDGKLEVERRFLFPQRVEFDRAEQQNMFQEDKRARPLGAFGVAAKIGAKRQRASGDFGTAPHSRGPILQVEEPGASVVDREYYPDAYTRGVWAHFLPIFPAGEAITPMARATPFRGPDRPVIENRPVMVEVKPAIPGSEEGERIWIDTSDQWYSPPQLPTVKIPKIAIIMQRATMADVDLVADFDPAEIMRNSLIGGGLAQAWARGATPMTPVEAAERLGKALAAGRINELQGSTRLRIVHAVQKPFAGAFIEATFAAVMVSVRAPTEDEDPAACRQATDHAQPTWCAIVARNNPKLPKRWSIPGGASCFFINNIRVDPASTGAVSCDAQWEDWGPEMARLNWKNGMWECYRGQQFARLFTVTKIGSSKASESVELHDTTAYPLGFSYSFRDGRARRLAMRTVARSRFVEYYPEAGATSSTFGSVGTCELPSKETTECWVPCTFRPAQPMIDRVTPLLTMTAQDGVRQQKYSFVRETSLRVELGSGCFATGEGEQLALLFHPFASTGVCDYGAELLRPYASGLTRWGRDPLTDIDDNALPTVNLRPQDFQYNPERFYDTFELHSGSEAVAPENKAPQPQQVVALGYEMKLDPATGVFYADIGIQSKGELARPYMPFVQLGLARLQVKAVTGLELSAPIGQMVQILPRRAGTVTFASSSETNRFDVELIGPLSRPRLGVICSLEVTTLERQEDRWQPQIWPDGSIARKEKTTQDSYGWSIKNLRMPKKRSAQHLGVLIEEFETITPPGEKPTKRLLFGHTVDFGEP